MEGETAQGKTLMLLTHAEKNDTWSKLADALEKTNQESILMAAQRVVRRRGRQIMAAHIVVKGEPLSGDDAWDNLAKALRVADRCRWPE